MYWAVKFPLYTTKFGRAWYNPKDLDIMFDYDNGFDFMKSMISFLDSRRIDSFGGQHSVPSTSQQMRRGRTSSANGNEAICWTDTEATHVHSE